MSDPLPNVTSLNSKIKPGQAYLSGLISSRRRLTGQAGTFWLTVVKLPAHDEYSNPATVEIRSAAPVGEINDKWQGVVTVTGYPRNYNTKADSETGEIKNIKSAQVILDVVEV